MVIVVIILDLYLWRSYSVRGPNQVAIHYSLLISAILIAHISHIHGVLVAF